MSTIMYLIRHGATEANLAQPARLQGRRHNPPLARLGIRQHLLQSRGRIGWVQDHCDPAGFQDAKHRSDERCIVSH